MNDKAMNFEMYSSPQYFRNGTTFIALLIHPFKTEFHDYSDDLGYKISDEK